MLKVVSVKNTTKDLLLEEVNERTRVKFTKQFPIQHISQHFGACALQYLGDVFVCFFPPLLYLPLNANNPHCASPSCLHDHEGKEKKHVYRNTQGKTNSEERVS